MAHVSGVEKNPCYLCARMRRGHLYSKAKELGCNKIALGHHFDDVIETILMSMLYAAEMRTMMPKLHSLNFEGMELIRPLYKVKEKDIIGIFDMDTSTVSKTGKEFINKKALIEKELERVHTTLIKANDTTNKLLESLNSSPITKGTKLEELLKRTELTYGALNEIDEDRPNLLSLCQFLQIE